MSTPREITDRLFARSSRGIKFGLEKITRGSSALGNPQKSYPCIHIAGTNGKGSTCALVESVLRRRGGRTGLFLSPHLVSFDERFLVDGEPVATEEWVEVYADCEKTIEKLDMTFFEASTLMAFELFRRKKSGVGRVRGRDGGAAGRDQYPLAFSDRRNPYRRRPPGVPW